MSGDIVNVISLSDTEGDGVATISIETGLSVSSAIGSVVSSTAGAGVGPVSSVVLLEHPHVVSASAPLLPDCVQNGQGEGSRKEDAPWGKK